MVPDEAWLAPEAASIDFAAASRTTRMSSGLQSSMSKRLGVSAKQSGALAAGLGLMIAAVSSSDSTAP